MFTAPLFAVAFFAAAPADPAAFVTGGAAGEPAVGTLVRLAPDGGVELTTPEGKVTVRDLVSLRRAAVALPPLPRGPVLITTTGDRIPGRLLGGDGETLKLRPRFADAEWDVPLSSVAVLWLAKPPADTPPDPARYTWLAGNRNRDILRFPNGDTAAGTLDGFGPDSALRFKPDVGAARVVRLAEMSAVAFNPALARSWKPKGPYARLVLRDGTRLAVTSATADAETLKGKTLFGQAVEIPVVEIVGFDVLQGKATYLADLKPKKVQQAGFLGTAWPWAANRTVHGTPLRLLTPAGGGTFDRGIGTHPRTVLTYDLGGKYRRFEALIGLDAASGSRGRAAVRILVDGKEQPLPQLLKLAAGPAVPVRIDTAGAKELTLVVDFGPAGDVQADVDWADARLVE